MPTIESRGNALDGAAPRPVSVLVVEDEVLVARDLQRSLADLGYDVLAAVASGDEALRKSDERVPDIALMDIRIAGTQDGVDTAAVLQQRHQVPVVYMTAYSDMETVSRALRSSPYGYIIKPFTTRELQSAIEVALRRHRIDRESAQRERWFSTMLHSIGDAVIACDPEQRVAFMNLAAERFTGWSRQEALGQALTDVVRLERADGRSLSELLRVTLGKAPPRDARGQELPKKARFASGVAYAAALPSSSRLTARGASRPLHIEDSLSAIMHEGSLLGAVLVLRDVSEQRQIQERAIVGDRLASLGTLAGGIAHEINNPLTFVIGNAYCLERVLGRWRELLLANGERERLAEIRDALDDLREGAERIQRIVADMSLFGASSVEPPELLDLRRCVEWALRVTASQARHRAQLSVELNPMPPVLGRENELGQVFVNLLVNAIQAVPEGEASRHAIRVVTGTDNRGFAHVSVHNRGPCIPAELMPRIFEPFFSTKPAGQGSGLGLTICRRVIDSFGGEISAESRPEHGTTIDVFLPPRSARVRSLQPDSIAPAAAQRGRVLVVDDEPAVLRILEQLVGEEHDVVRASSAREALREIEQDARFDAIVCDVMMPEMSGQELLQEVRARWPALAPAFVFITGGAYSPGAAEFLDSIDNPRLEKPFALPKLLSAIESRMHRTEPGGGSPAGGNGAAEA